MADDMVLGCTALTSIIIDEQNPNYTSANVNCIIDKQTSTLIAGRGNIVPQGVKHISDFAFYWAEIESIVLPKSIETIGDYAFLACFNLIDVYYYGTADELYSMAEDSCLFDNMQNLYVYVDGDWVKAN